MRASGATRGIDRAVMAHLVDCSWVGRHENLLITGPTGLGKSWIACALGHKACRDGHTVAYHRVPRIFEKLAIARGDGRHARMLKTLARTDLLILDDWGLATLTSSERRDLLEILEDRHGSGSTIVTSQLPVEHWHEAVGDPTLADAILDRLVHNAHRLPLAGESMRKRAATLKPLDPAGQAWPHYDVGQTARGLEWLPTMPWNPCPRSRGTGAHLPWNTQVGHKRLFPGDVFVSLACRADRRGSVSTACPNGSPGNPLKRPERSRPAACQSASRVAR